MAKGTRNLLLCIGLLFHVTYIWSIFDIYFTSPLVHGMTPHKVDLPPPARRLVLFVGDGLRADKLYQLYQDENNSSLFTRAPFLRDIVLNHGTWGVSHTRVPTESRPGHVAIIAGFYEDVSAVTKGWKTNPVEFDSVFNQSRHTWSFGSPDILPMFAEGASDPERVDTFMYGHENENFAEDATELDTWTFNKFAELLSNSSSNNKLYQQLHDDKIIIFLHLLGLDTNGHAYGPHSQEYLNNIKVVDDGIYKTIQLLDEFYGNDMKTAYVFTSDHGMSNRGNHGDGHPDNTRTPIVAWGAGINRPNKEHPTGHDEFSMDWQLNSVQRNDILQADIAPLMASLIGINYPVNSVGELPLKYLNNTPLFKAQSIFVNAKEILEQYQVKYELKKRTKLMFKSFAPLSNSTHSPDIFINNIQRLIDTEKYVEAENLCRILVSLCLEGLRYFQTYDWFMLRSIVTAGYVGWIVYSLKFTLKEYAFNYSAQSTVASNDPYGLLVLLLICILYVEESPITYYTYVIFPIYFWRDVIIERNIILDCCRSALDNQSIFTSIIYVIGYIIGLEILASFISTFNVVYSYFERNILSICFVLAALCPWFISSKIRTGNSLWFFAWTISCLFTSIFTLLPVEKGEDITLVYECYYLLLIIFKHSFNNIYLLFRILGGLLVVITGCIALWESSKFTIGSYTSVRNMIGFQVGLVVLSIIVVYDTTNKLKDKAGLPFLNQIIAWIILAISTATPFVYGLGKQHYFQRLTTISLSFAPLFVLLSISYEVLFYYFLTITLMIWHQIEYILFITSNPTLTLSHKGQTRKLVIEDIRVALVFLFFINVAFFGTGNIASLSSFSLQSVYRLTTVFDPFLMGALLVFKILIPFFIVSSVFGVINKSLNLPPFSLFLLVLSTSDIMTMNFFYLVRDYGSWLEIGTTISHFVISSLFSLFMILLFLLSELFVGEVIVDFRKITDEKKVK
ncbi:putative GPI-anchor [Gigaspora rosea]|uniref:GPI ethanolamine phosphate transferase 1 n=1 Tax=Gigaspora rosea TaxID=44941 RepID=A0A397URG5_9GLOM|nr:putative GPI-anchor [Gigaspora rosea]